MYVIFRVIETGAVECHQMSHWLVQGDEATIYTLEDDPLEYQDGQWVYLGYEVELLEMTPDIRRFLR